MAALVALTATCRCGEPELERSWEVGVPLQEIPAAVPGGLADYLPAGAPLFVSLERPAEVLRLIRADPRLARALDPKILADVAFSDTGVAARALRQRLNDLSRLPVPHAGLETFFDGPLVLAARTGPGGLDVLVVKRLTREAQASWQAAQMLQAVTPSLREVRVERYRGFPLRKVLVNDRRRITYVLLRDLLVAGTSDTWVKESLDLALGGQAARASAQPAIHAALADERTAPLLAVLDAEALRAEPGRPGPAMLALQQLSWVRAALHPRKGLVLAAQPLGSERPAHPSSLLSRYAPHGTLAAVSRSLDLGGALRALLPSSLSGPQAAAAGTLRDRLLQELAPTLGTEGFWLTDGLDTEEDGPGAHHLVGFALRDPARAKVAIEALAPDLLAAPVEIDHEGHHDVFCGAGALCLCATADILLVSNHAATLKAALGAAGAHKPLLALPPAADGASEVLFLDAGALSAALGQWAELDARRHDTDPKDVAARVQAMLGLVRGLGVVVATLTPSAGRLAGEVVAP